MNMQEMTAKIAGGQGFIAALDQSGGSTPKALRAYGVADDEWSGDEEMFGKMHEMRSRIITAPSFTGDKVIGAILFERTMDGEVAGQPTPHALIEKGIVPFIKIDKGLEDEANGVQLMKPMPDLSALLTRAKALGVFGTKARSVINAANPQGIAAIVAQQFAVAQQVIEHGMMPILEPEYAITAQDRAAGEEILKNELLKHCDALPDGQQVMIKLSIPAVAGAYDDLIAHPKVLRVVALSGGFNRSQACAELVKNPGIIASFSRALLAELQADMDDAQFDSVLSAAIAEIHSASIASSQA